MVILNGIRKPVEKEMAQFESFFFDTMKSNIPFLRIILNYVIRRKGKQMRPLLVLLSAAINGNINESTYVAATMIELLHTASLVHDDVVDNADERRGAPSIKALWNSRIAVLLGDYLLSKGLLVSVDSGRFDMLKIISEAVQSMTQSELTQIQKIRKFNTTEEEYFGIISGKTAALISACTATGTLSVTDEIQTINLMKEFGQNIGIAFQIKDDLLDYSTKGLTGKNACNDIKEGKLTLPLIHSLKTASFLDQRKIIPVIKNKNKTEKDISKVVHFVLSNGGLEYTESQMTLYTDKAIGCLSGYPESPYKQSLIDFVNYSVARNH
jgi:octaprenyl-diphosphate synthase